MDIGNSMKLARKKSGLTQIEVANKAGIAVNSLRLYESGKRQPTIETIQRIADAVGVPIIRFFGVVLCRDCKFAHLTDDGEVKCCDEWEEFGDLYLDGDFYCASGQRRELSNKVIVAGNCTVCGKPLESGRMFLCNECQKKESQRRE